MATVTEHSKRKPLWMIYFLFGGINTKLPPHTDNITSNNLKIKYCISLFFYCCDKRFWNNLGKKGFILVYNSREDTGHKHEGIGTGRDSGSSSKLTAHICTEKAEIEQHVGPDYKCYNSLSVTSSFNKA